MSENPTHFKTGAATHCAGAAPDRHYRPTLVLLHGIGGNAVGLAPAVAALESRGWPSVAWSQPGYDGKPLVEPYDLDTCARALGEWLATQGPGGFVLVGHSMGGMLAQAFNAQLGQAARLTGPADAARRDRPPRAGVVGLVLPHTSPAFGKPGGEFQQRFIASRTRALDEGKSMREIAATLVPGMMAPAASAAAREAGVAMMAAVPPQTYRLAVAAISAFDARAHLPRIAVPTLCLAAAHDETAAPGVLERMAQHSPGADYQCLDGLGHLAPIEDPPRWAAAVAAWCDRRIGREMAGTGGS